MTTASRLTCSAHALLAELGLDDGPLKVTTHPDSTVTVHGPVDLVCDVAAHIDATRRDTTSTNLGRYTLFDGRLDGQPVQLYGFHETAAVA